MLPLHHIGIRTGVGGWFDAEAFDMSVSTAGVSILNRAIHGSKAVKPECFGKDEKVLAIRSLREGTGNRKTRCSFKSGRC
jgi:hypothetical protein